MPRRILEGDVVSDKMDKTVTVLVERRTMHPVYKKYVKQTKKYAAHDENNSFKVGDRVQIEECRPISRSKRWKVITVPAAGAGRPARLSAVSKVDAKAAKPPKAEKRAAPAPAKAEIAEKKVAAPKKAAAKKATSKKKDADE